jgi:transposase, IS5 family
MQTTPNPQFGLLDSLMSSSVSNDFLEKLDRALDWKPIEAVLQTMYPATTGRPPCPPLVLFKMSLLQHCYGLSDPQCEELVADRISWRRFVGLGLQDKVPDETTLVYFRRRLREEGAHDGLLLQLVNRQLEEKGLILRTCTLVDATLLQASRRPTAKDQEGGGDPQAGFTIRKGQLHHGYKAHVGVDQAHTLIRQVTLTQANVHDSQEFETVVRGDEEMVLADKAYWSEHRSRWCFRRNIINGILRKAPPKGALDARTAKLNRRLSRIRCGIEKIFGWWKRCTGYRRVRYVGREPNRLELEFKSICWNLKRMTSLTEA